MKIKENNTLHLSRKEQIGQCLHPAAFIHDTPAGIAEIEQFITEYKIGGLTFFYSRESVETNFNRKKGFKQKEGSIEKLVGLINRYQKLSDITLLISIDAEWGLGMRISSHAPFPYPMTLAATGDTEITFRAGKAIAKELRQVGIHINLAPVVDVNTNPKNPVIGYRSFGGNPQTVAEHAQSFYNGLQSEGIMGCLKHFPGHGDTQTGSHLALPIIDKHLDELYNNELFTFRKLIESGVECVMTGHILIPSLDEKPCSLSRKIIQDILREQLGFEGVIISDALNMQSVFKKGNKGELEYEAFMAGNDILSFSKNIPEAIKLIDSNTSNERIAESCKRIMQLKTSIDISDSKASASIPDSSTLRQEIAHKAITLFKQPKRAINSLSDTIIYVIYVNKKIRDSQFLLKHTCSYYEIEEVLENDALEKENRHCIMVVYPPSYKPTNSFGFERSMLRNIHQLANRRDMTLCLFGNPYSIGLFDIDKFHSVVLAYQDLPEFEKAAADYFSGNLQAIGTVPLIFD